MTQAPIAPATAHQVQPSTAYDDDEIDLLEILITLVSHWRLLVFVPIIAGALALGVTYLIVPTYTAKTTFLPPQQQQSSAASALASLGGLADLAGGVAGIKSPAAQYVSLMQSINAQDRIIDKFKLMDIYKAKYRFQARQALEGNSRITLGKKDGLINVEADATDPKLAADIANQYVAELRRLSGELALTEAQQRRKFFEDELRRTRPKLTEAQQILQSSGFNPGALKAEPKAAAEGYATLKAEATSAEVKLQTMRRSLADSAPEIQQQLVLLGALRTQLNKIESSSNSHNDADYITRYREFKYQEALFELFSKQYEMARLDESKEGALIQVIDIATPPEHKSKPKRAFIAIITTMATLLLLILWVFVRHAWHGAKQNSGSVEKFTRLRSAWRR